MLGYDAGASRSLVGEYDGSGNLIQETVWLGDIPVATIRPSGSAVAIYYVVTDQLDTPRAVLRPSDNTQMWTWSSGPFGAEAPNTNPQGAGTFTYDLRFPGQIAGAWGSTSQNDNRDYDPQVGRYVESDPLGLQGGINTYAYVRGDPISIIDTQGLCPSQEECDAQREADEEVCRSLPNDTVEEKAIRSRCWDSSTQRYGNCIKNKPLGPLVTWRMGIPIVPPSGIGDIPSPSPALPAGLLLLLLPWPGNPIYLGL